MIEHIMVQCVIYSKKLGRYRNSKDNEELQRVVGLVQMFSDRTLCMGRGGAILMDTVNAVLLNFSIAFRQKIIYSKHKLMILLPFQYE